MASSAALVANNANRSRPAVSRQAGVIPGQRGPGPGPVEPALPLSLPTSLSLLGVSRLVVALDALVIVSALVLAWPLREAVPYLRPATDPALTLALQTAPVILLLWITLLAINGAYAPRALGAGIAEFERVGRGTAVAAFAASTALYLTNMPLARGFLVGCFLLGAPLLIMERYAVRRWIHKQRRDGLMSHRVLAMGSATAVGELAVTLNRERHLGYEIVARGRTPADRDSQSCSVIPVVEPTGDIARACERLGVDTVMVVGDSGVQMRELAWDLEGRDVDLVVVPQLADVAGTRLQMHPVAGLPLLHVGEPTAGRACAWPKRLFDCLGAGFALLVLAPVMLVVAAVIKLSDGGPVLYRQVRVGLHGEPFSCFKFRSMSVDADKKEASLRSEHRHDGALFKLEHDPRVTRVGAFIRRYSVDELPQLFNVINGTMSLVGPRPQQQWEVDTYTETARRRLQVLPGMTGLWQVSGRSRLSWEDALRLDLHYRDNWSMITDIIIMGKTVRAVLGSDGAY